MKHLARPAIWKSSPLSSWKADGIRIFELNTRNKKQFQKFVFSYHELYFHSTVLSPDYIHFEIFSSNVIGACCNSVKGSCLFGWRLPRSIGKSSIPAQKQ
jgi:hypothetical protein